MALLIVKKLRDLCATPANRAHIVHNDTTTVSGLVVFLKNEDETVVYTALEAINFLSRSADNRPALARVPGLVDSVQALMFSSFGAKVKRMSISTYTLLQDVATKNETKVTSKKRKSAAPDGPRKQKKTATTHIVFVKGLSTEEKRKEVESALLRKKGVISFLIDLFSHKVTIRSTLSTEDIMVHIQEECSMKCSVTEFEEDEVDKENFDHDYLSEAEPSEKNAQAGWFGWSQKEKPSTEIMVTNSNQQEAGWFGRITRSLWG